MEPKRIIYLFILLAILVAGCDQPHVSVAKGNSSFRRGEFQEAIVEYISLSETEEFAPWLSYNLGNVFFALGEYNSAAMEWKKAEDTRSGSLLFKLHFNQGVRLYRTGRYKEAYNRFKEVLLVEPASRDAKTNLEHCLLKLNARKTEAAQHSSATEAKNENLQQAERILEYVKRSRSPRYRPADGEDKTKGVKDW